MGEHVRVCVRPTVHARNALCCVQARCPQCQAPALLHQKAADHPCRVDPCACPHSRSSSTSSAQLAMRIPLIAECSQGGLAWPAGLFAWFGGVSGWVGFEMAVGRGAGDTISANVGLMSR